MQHSTVCRLFMRDGSLDLLIGLTVLTSDKAAEAVGTMLYALQVVTSN